MFVEKFNNTKNRFGINLNIDDIKCKKNKKNKSNINIKKEK